MPGKTGRALEEWIELVHEDGPDSERDRRAWLKSEHGMGTNGAWWIAELAEGRGAEDGDPAAYLKAADGYVASMFSGKSAALRPICDKILEPGTGAWRRRPDLPLQDGRPALSQARDRRDQAGRRRPDRPGLRIAGHGADRQADRHRRLRQAGSHHPRRPDPDPLGLNAEVKRWLRWAYDLDA